MSLHEPTEYNEYIGQETVNCEYKEFTFNLAGLPVDNKLAEQYCTTNKFDFNPNVLFNLTKYFKAYIPKYACGYFNSGIDGSCYIGINDYGFVKGIPFKGRIPVQKLKNKITKVLGTNIDNPSNSNIDWDNLLEIKVIPIDYAQILSGELKQNEKFTNYQKTKRKYINEYNEFVARTNQWRLQMNFAVNKLVDLANNPKSRNQIIQWIKSIEPTNPVIQIFEADDFKLEYKSHDEIIKIRDDSSEPYYWVTKWKDMMIDNIKSSRPIFQSTFNSHNTPINLLVSASEMIPYWLTYNTNMKLYVIQIKFFGSKLAIDNSDSDELFPSSYNNFRYLDANTKRWARCYRTTIANGEPVCMPF
mgnify:CR=1 FL=1